MNKIRNHLRETRIRRKSKHIRERVSNKKNRNQKPKTKIIFEKWHHKTAIVNLLRIGIWHRRWVKVLMESKYYDLRLIKIDKINFHCIYC